MAGFCLVIWIASRIRAEGALAILEHLSRMGHKEVARSYAACMRSLLAAGGAGLITALTVVGKVLIVSAQFSRLQAVVLVALNFVMSFAFIQILGFRLATKQAPLLGAALGRLWSGIRAGIAHPQAAQETQWSLRTQAASAIGNLFFVIPGAVLFQVVYQWRTGEPFLDQAAAQSALQSLDPWNTGTLLYAAFTGFLLWACMYFAGFFADRVGGLSKARVSMVFNVSLGLCLAFLPALGARLGLPIDVRHFTLSGGTLALAVSSLGFEGAPLADVAAASIGVLWIGVLNFTVSFGLAFVASWLNGGRDGPILSRISSVLLPESEVTDAT